MSPDSESRQIRDLVRAIAGFTSTNDLLLFVAGHKKMLSFCQRLIEEYDRDRQSGCVQQVKTVCAAQGVPSGLLFSEVRKVLLALNRFHDRDKDHYQVLGLTPDADTAEVKKAYRKLSMQCHPDTAKKFGKNADRFMEVSAAYHSIMVNGENQDSNHISGWYQTHPYQHHGQPHNKIFFAGLFCLVIVLVCFSVLIARHYYEKISINQPDLAEYPAAVRNDLSRKKSAPAASLIKPKAATVQDNQPETIALQPNTGAAQLKDSIGPIPVKRVSPPPPDQNILIRRANLADSPASDRNDISLKKSAPASSLIKPKAATVQDNQPETIALQPNTGTAQLKDSIGPIPVKRVSLSGKKIDRHNKTRYSPASHPFASGPPQKSAEPMKTENPNAEPETEATVEISPERQTVSPWKAMRIASINSKLQILSFVSQYTRLYNRKDLGQYLALFFDNATENNIPVTTLRDDYKKLFAKTRTIRLEIKNIKWRNTRNGFQVYGDFIGNFIYNDGHTFRQSGAITFSLLPERNQLKIVSLTYVFKRNGRL